MRLIPIVTFPIEKVPIVKSLINQYKYENVFCFCQYNYFWQNAKVNVKGVANSLMEFHKIFVAAIST